MTEQELDRILTFEWPAVIRWAKIKGDEWIAGFSISIARNGKRKNWRPSAKQEHIMRRLLAEKRADDTALRSWESEPELIEE